MADPSNGVAQVVANLGGQNFATAKQHLGQGVNTTVSARTAFTLAVNEVNPQLTVHAPRLLTAAGSNGISPVILVSLLQQENPQGNPSIKGYAGDDFGLMQINKTAHPDFFATKDWTNPDHSAQKAAEIMKANYAFFSKVPQKPVFIRGVWIGKTPGYTDPRPLSGYELTRAAVAAYNTGAGNALYGLAVYGDPGYTTTNGNYAARVMHNALLFSQALAAVDQGFVKADALLAMVLDPSTSSLISTVYHDAYDRASGVARATRMAASTRQELKTQAALEKMRKGVALKTKAGLVQRAALAASAPRPVFDTTSASPQLYDFDAGGWGDKKEPV